MIKNVEHTLILVISIKIEFSILTRIFLFNEIAALERHATSE